MIRILILFFCSGVLFGQRLQRQMISANGKVVSTSSGIKVSHSIAQQSITGTSIKEGMVVSQGFQQNNISLNEATSNYTTVFPNPVIDHVNFKMTTPVIGKIAFSLYDVQGKLLVRKEKEAENTLLTITDLSFPSGKYFVTLDGTNYSFKTSIIFKSK